jgi:hypothetical protein
MLKVRNLTGFSEGLFVLGNFFSHGISPTNTWWHEVGGSIYLPCSVEELEVPQNQGAYYSAY